MSVSYPSSSYRSRLDGPMHLTPEAEPETRSVWMSGAHGAQVLSAPPRPTSSRQTTAPPEEEEEDEKTRRRLLAHETQHAQDKADPRGIPPTPTSVSTPRQPARPAPLAQPPQTAAARPAPPAGQASSKVQPQPQPQPQQPPPPAHAGGAAPTAPPPKTAAAQEPKSHSNSLPNSGTSTNSGANPNANSKPAPGAAVPQPPAAPATPAAAAPPPAPAPAPAKLPAVPATAPAAQPPKPPATQPSTAPPPAAPRTFAKDRGTQKRIAELERTGIVVEPDASGHPVAKPHPEGNGPLYRPQFMAQKVELGRESGRYEIPFRDDRGRTHLVPLDSMRRTTNAAGQVMYEFELPQGHRGEPRTLRVPEDPQAPLFQVDEKTGRRYQEILHPAAPRGRAAGQPGKREMRELGVDPAARARLSVPGLQDQATQAQQAAEARAADAAGQHAQEQQRYAEADARRQQAIQKRAALESENADGSIYRNMQGEIVRVQHTREGEVITPVLAADRPRAEDWLRRHGEAMKEIAQRDEERTAARARLQEAEKRSMGQDAYVLFEHRRKQQEIAATQDKARDPNDPAWKKDARSLGTDDALLDRTLIAEMEQHGSTRTDAMRQATQSGAARHLAAAMDTAFTPKPGQAPAVDAQGRPQPRSMSLHEMLLQGPEVRQKGNNAIVPAENMARATALNAFGITDPENVRVTRGADGLLELSRPGADGTPGAPFARVDPRGSRITLLPGAARTPAGQALLQGAQRGTLPVYLPGQQPPMGDAELTGLIRRGMQAVEQAKDLPQAEAALTQLGLSPEGLTRLAQEGRLSLQDRALLNEKFNSGAPSYAARQQGQAAQAKATAVQDLYLSSDKKNLTSWQSQDDPQRNAQLKAKAQELGIPEADLRKQLETQRLLDWSRPSSQTSHDLQSNVMYGFGRATGQLELAEPTRTLPDGSVIPHPEVLADRAEFDKAIDGAAATPQAKAAAKAKWDEYHTRWLTSVRPMLEKMETLPGVENYLQWRDRKQAGMVNWTEEQKAEQYLQEQKGRGGFRKLADNISSNLIAGSHDILTGIYGTAALVTGSTTLADMAAAKAGDADALTSTLEITGNDSLGDKIVGGVTRALPGLAATEATGGLVGGGTRIVAGSQKLSTAVGGAAAFTQSAGSTFTDLYRRNVESGMSADAALKAAAPGSAAAGLMSAALTKVFPKGVESLRQPATQAGQAAAQAAQGAVREAMRAPLKSALQELAEKAAKGGMSVIKGAADEVPEELLDGAVTHFITEMNAGKTAQEATASYLEQLPQNAAVSALLGGGAQGIKDGVDAHNAGKPLPLPPTQGTAPQENSPAQGNAPTQAAPPTAQQPTPQQQQTPPAGLPTPLADHQPQTLPPGQQEEKQPQPSAGKPTPPSGSTDAKAPTDLPEYTTPAGADPAPNTPPLQDSTTPSAAPSPKPPPTTAEAVAAHKAAAKLKAQGENLTPQQTHELDTAERTVASAQVANLKKKQEVIAQQGRDLHPTEARALAGAQARLAQPETAPPPVKPSHAPQSVERSRQLLANVAKMRPEARAHPQVQADLVQAQRVVDQDAAARQPQPDQNNSADAAPRNQQQQTPQQDLQPPAQPDPASPLETAATPSPHTPGSVAAPPGTRMPVPTTLRDSETSNPQASNSGKRGDSGSAEVTEQLTSPDALASIPPPANLPPTPAWVDPAHVAYWDKKLAAARVRDPAQASDVVEVLSSLQRPEKHKDHFQEFDRLQIHRAVQSFLDVLPGDLVRSLPRFTLGGATRAEIKERSGQDGIGLFSSERWQKNRVLGVDKHERLLPGILLSYELSGNETLMRQTIWHEMTHWLWENADRHPALARWRNALEHHFDERTASDAPEYDQAGGYWFLRDHWIIEYAGKIVPASSHGERTLHPEVLELATVYMEYFAMGGSGAARWDIYNDARSTFELGIGILGDKK